MLGQGVLAGHLAGPTELHGDPPVGDGHPEPRPAQTGGHPGPLDGLAEHLVGPPVGEGQLDPHSALAALAGPLPVLSGQALHDPQEQAGHGGHLGPLAGLAGDGANRSLKACRAPCEDTCSSVPSFCSAWSHWCPLQFLSSL